MQKESEFHEGRPIIRQYGKFITVLCPYGHVYSSTHVKDWAGSALEAKATDPKWMVRCGVAISRG